MIFHGATLPQYSTSTGMVPGSLWFYSRAEVKLAANRGLVYCSRIQRCRNFSSERQVAPSNALAPCRAGALFSACGGYRCVRVIKVVCGRVVGGFL